MNIGNLKGITLTELIMASVMLGVVMLGIISVDYASRKTQQTTSRDTLVSATTAATLLDITKTAEQTVGDTAIAANIGVQSAGGGSTTCFRQDLNAFQNQTPNEYTNDSWICYTTSSTNNNIVKCTQNNIAACPNPPPTSPPNPTNAYILGTSITGGLSIAWSNGAIGIANPQAPIIITLTNSYTPSSTTYNLNNPKISLSTEVYPSGHAFK